MKIVAILVSLFLSQTIWADNAQQKHSVKKTLSFILLGQSNMAGQGKVSELGKQRKILPKNVNFFLNGSIVKLPSLKKFGPEVSFAHAISSSFPRKKINIIKFAPGGSLMKDWLKDGNHYKTLKIQLGRIGKNTNLNPAAILWMQGERDTKSAQLAKSYPAHLTKFIKKIRQDLNKPKLTFIIARVSIPESFRPAVNAIRTAQELVSRKVPNVRLFSTDSLKKNPDKVHFNTNGQLKLGRLFAETLLRTGD